MSAKILILGLGNMGNSLLGGLGMVNAKSGMGHEIFAFDIHEEKRQSAVAKGVKILDSLESFPMDDVCVIVCVKPHDLAGICNSLIGRLAKSTILVSILAGTTISKLVEKTGHKGAIVRVMPNIAATVGYAATAMTANDQSSATTKVLVKEIFDAVGESYWTTEKMMDVVTGLSGSGPAYIYMVIEALTDGGVKVGMPRELAGKLATQTVLGAAMMVKKSGSHPAVLKDQVSTPAGTTISALVELESKGLRSMFVSAVVAATERSRELGKITES